MIHRTASVIAICGVVLLGGAAPGVLAAPNAHANQHAQSNAGGNGNGNGNGGVSGGGGNGNGSVVHQYVLANGLKQGQVASQLKSWNSLNANPKAFFNNLNNPNSLLGKEAAYICANASSQTALSTYDNLVTTAGGDPSSPPPTDAENATAQTFLADETTLGTFDPKVVVADTTNTYSPEVVTAAQFVLDHPTLTVASAQATVDEYTAWTTYQTTAQTASADFAAASVSYKGSTDLTKLQATVNGIIAQKNLDTTKLCASSTASTQ